MWNVAQADIAEIGLESWEEAGLYRNVPGERECGDLHSLKAKSRMSWDAADMQRVAWARQLKMDLSRVWNRLNSRQFKRRVANKQACCITYAHQRMSHWINALPLMEPQMCSQSQFTFMACYTHATSARIWGRDRWVLPQYTVKTSTELHSLLQCYKP